MSDAGVPPAAGETTMTSGSGAERGHYGRVLDETRALLQRHRESGARFRALRVRKPFLEWFWGDDPRFDRFYRDQMRLLKRGRVVWGRVIQANRHLFVGGTENLPGAFLYSTDEAMDERVDLLERTAEHLFSTKGAATEPDLAEISRMLADGGEAIWKLAVPTRLTEGLTCYFVTNMIHRKHLPRGVLSDFLLPMLILPEETEVASILPSRFWSLRLLEERWR